MTNWTKKEIEKQLKDRVSSDYADGLVTADMLREVAREICDEDAAKFLNDSAAEMDRPVEISDVVASL